MLQYIVHGWGTVSQVKTCRGSTCSLLEYFHFEFVPLHRRGNCWLNLTSLKLHPRFLHFPSSRLSLSHRGSIGEKRVKPRLRRIDHRRSPPQCFPPGNAWVSADLTADWFRINSTRWCFIQYKTYYCFFIYLSDLKTYSVQRIHVVWLMVTFSS